jgi:O-antigen ligase
LAYLSILILYISTIENPDQYNWAGLIPGIPNIRSLGFFSVAGFAAGAAISFRSSRKFHFPLGLFFASIAVGLAVWSATRGALFAILAVVLFLFVQRSEYRNLRFVSWVAGVVAIGVLLSTVSYKPNDQFGLNRLFASIDIEKKDGALDRLSAGRVQIWKETVPEIVKRPLFGFGERQFRKIGPERARGLNQPHNIFLQIAFQWGIVGALLFFLLLARLGLQVWRKTKRGKNMGIGEQMLVISILVYSLYDAALFYPYPIMMFTLAVALALAAPTQPAPAADR